MRVTPHATKKYPSILDGALLGVYAARIVDATTIWFCIRKRWGVLKKVSFVRC